ncbi:MAG: class IV adenylate cyclase [Candidatus Heimdallarchaeaceae archaeon]
MKEIELKAYFFPEEKENVVALERQIEEETKKEFVIEEIEDIFFDNENLLKNADEQLRLRKQGVKCFLTFKGKVDKTSGYKVREELEVEIDNCRILEKILLRIGFRKVKHISKIRKTLLFNNTQITIDIFQKIGVVIEVEGKEEEIEKTIELLALPRRKFKPMTYNDVLQLYRDQYQP